MVVMSEIGHTGDSQAPEKTLEGQRPSGNGGRRIREEEKGLDTTVKRLRKDISAVAEDSKRREERELRSRWRSALNLFRSKEASRLGTADYPRMEKLFEVVRGDGKVRLMLSYDQYNPEPNLANEGERRQVEALLKFEQPLAQLILEAGNRWRAGDFNGEAALLEEYASSNPQRETILDLAAEARRDALSGASSPSRQKRR